MIKQLLDERWRMDWTLHKWDRHLGSDRGTFGISTTTNVREDVGGQSSGLIHDNFAEYSPFRITTQVFGILGVARGLVPALG
ncbi:hypothetical protein V7S43_016011 [Phytophthora oleae]|uniref:Uncharacterized protein n=1 Tax=Phytophthora oleae TaxID=2107226 RepID=A0ABD3EWP7_9STRA